MSLGPQGSADGSTGSEAIVQQGRWLQVDGPLGDGTLVLTSFDGDEALSRPFRFRLGLLSKRNDLTPEEILGKSFTARIRRNDDDHRIFNGLAASMTSGRMKSRGYKIYEIEIVPWLWLLTLRTDCRIFENKTALEVIETVFQAAGFTDFDDSGVKGPHAKREYCVQYRETDFDFVSRLMEQVGIFYFFRYEEGRHVLVMADDVSAYMTIKEGTALYSDGFDTFNVVSDLKRQSLHRSGKVSRRDYDFKSAQPISASKTALSVAPKQFQKFELYDYPGGTTNKADLETFCRVRMEDEETHFQTAFGQGNCTSFQPAGKVQFERQPDGGKRSQTAVLTQVEHHAVDETHVVEGAAPDYRNAFTVIPDDVVFRPAQETAKALVRGPQTAVVIGPDGEETHCDEYGRIRLRFHWDRKDGQSCWVRVAQLWAGKNWGSQFIPRVGMEVVVDFLEGDPDRPLVVGCVYNGKNPVPYELPAKASQSGVKSRSTKGGAESNFNELRFDDKRGAEEVYLQAERDFTRLVKNDDKLEVRNEQTIVVKKSRSAQIEEGDDALVIAKGDRSVSVTEGKLTVEAKQCIELRVGQSSVKIEPDQVTISSVKVVLQGQAEVDLTGPAVNMTTDGTVQVRALALDVQTTMTQIEAAGQMTLRGGIVKVN